MCKPENQASSEFCSDSPHSDASSAQILDLEDGLRHFDGKRPSYQRMLKSFPESHNDASLDQLQLLLEKGERPTAERMAHTLKSMAAMLGAAPLRAAAAEVESSIRSGVPYESLLPEISETRARLGEVCRVIQGMALKSGHPVLMDVEPHYVRQLISRLFSQLEMDDFEAAQTWDELGPLLAEAIGEATVTELDKHIQSFELPAALTCLKCILESRPALKP